MSADEFDIGQLPRLIEEGSDFTLAEHLKELRALVESLKEADHWTGLRERADFELVKRAIRRKLEASSDENLSVVCVNTLEELEDWDNPGFLVKILTQATSRARKADQLLYATLRLALAGGLLDDSEYLNIAGVSMNAQEVEKHRKVAELILGKQGVKVPF